jgi:GT2 family glycosyltransferase
VTPALSVVIPTWNGRELLERFLPSVVAEAERWAQAHGQGCEVVVSDDGSTDGTAAWLAEHCAEVRQTLSVRNQGFAPAANAGVAAAQAPVVVLLNNDLEMTPGGLDFVSPWFDDAEVFGVTFRGCDWPEKTFATGGKLGRWRKGHWETWRNFEAPTGPTFMLVGGFCAFRREMFLSLGGFDPIFAPYYSEDLDLSYRARKRGWKLVYDPRTVVLHELSSSVSRHRNAFYRAKVTERNRLLFHWRNLDRGSLLWHLAWAHLLLAHMLIKGNFAYHAGYAQALARLPQVWSHRALERAHWKLSDRDLEVSAPPVTNA